MHIYNKETGKVLLASFALAEGMKKDNADKSTSELHDFWRTKTYVKPKDMLESVYPVFPQPYQLGQNVCGGTWNEYNKCFVVQVAGCNLDCWYCFVDKELRTGDEGCGKWFSPEEVIDMYINSGTDSRILRISGGEPTLAPEFLVEMIRESELCEYLLWIDTNLSTGRSFVDLYREETLGTGYDASNAAICGCFKGFSASDASLATAGGLGLLDAQFEAAAALVKETNLNTFFYVPGIVHGIAPETAEAQIREFFDRMVEEIDVYAPLRTYILEVKDYSPTKSDKWAYWKTDFYGIRPIDVWTQLCRDHYTAEELWLPCHQIEFSCRR